ncbi:MAG: hypothetical protein E7595_04780 [Ruminococcaceae bacterium]|nr:hypothetical protein [Oscillospiraceae bacterium]
MKKLIIILLSALLLLCSCAGSEEESSQMQSSQSADMSVVSEEESNHDGETKKLVSKLTIKNETGKISQTNVYEYDSLGRTVTVVTESEQGTIYNYIGYDENGYEAEYITKDASGNIQSHHQYERDEYGYVKIWRSLDKNGKLIAENKMDVDYDDQGRMLNVYVNGELSQYYSYDEEGNATERRVGTEAYNIYDKDNNKIEAVDGDYHMTAIYENGRAIEANATRGENTYKTTYEYDGELLLAMTNYENGEITIKYTFEYDSDGDIIKETMQNALGISVSISEYEYDYFPIEDQEEE